MAGRMLLPLLLFVGLLHPILASLIGNSVSYQAHSFNDLRQWPQLFAKGIVMIKIDPQYATASFCAGQTRSNVSDTRGCLLLNHDSLSSDRTNYNTTSDVLDIISNVEYSNWFRDPNHRVFISLCFKGCGGTVCPCDHSEGSNNWLSLVDEFVDRANDVIATNKLNVEFILDGDGNPGILSSPCLAQRWRPWNSVYITGNNPKQAFYDNNENFGWDRLVCLNERQSDWNYAIENDFGKFINISNYSYLLWEPSDQPTILTDVDEYIDHVSMIDHGNIHESGMRFAINIDPAQFESYIGTRSGRAWDEVIIPFSESIPENKNKQPQIFKNKDISFSSKPKYASDPYTNPVLTVVKVNQPTYLFVAIVSFIANADDDDENTAQYELLGFNNTGGTMVLLGSGLYNNLLIGNESEIDFMSLSVSSLPTESNDLSFVAVSAILAFSNGSQFLQEQYYDLVNNDNDDNEILLVLRSNQPDTDQFDDGILGVSLSVFSCSYVDDMTTIKRNDATNDAVDDDNDEEANLCHVMAYSQASDEDCALWLEVSSTSLDDLLASRTCLLGAPSANYLIDSQNLSVAAIETKDHAISVAVMYAIDGIVYGASASISPSTTTASKPAFLVSVNGNGAAAPLQLYVGANPTVSLGLNDSETGAVIFGVSGNGYCGNSESHNKNAHIGLCDQLPIQNSNGQYLNYYYGTLSAWTESLMFTLNTTENEMMFAGSPCSVLIANGMFSMGSSPSAALWLNNDDAPAWEAAVVYLGINEDAQDPCGCGIANPSPETIKMGSWQMAQSFFTSNPV